MQSQDKQPAQSHDGQPSGDANDAQAKKVFDWGKKYDYQPRSTGTVAPGTLRRGLGGGKLQGLSRQPQSPRAAMPQPAVATQPATAPAQPAAAPAQPATATPAGPPRTPDWSKGVALKKALKGDHDKKVALIEVDGRTWVLKGAEGTPESHVAATEFIGKLTLKGVRAPKTLMLDAADKAAVLQALSGQAQSDKHADDMIKALTKGVGQLSEPVAGRTLDKIIPKTSVFNSLQEAIPLREGMAAKSDGDAWTDAFNALAKKAAGRPFDKRPNYVQWRDAADAGSRQKAVREMREEIVTPAAQPMIDVLAEIAGGNRQQGLTDAKAEAAAIANDRAQLQTFVKSDDGIAAFAGVAACDLVSGMYDRMVDTWNGGNFLFDSATQQLCCVDNAKKPEQGLLAPDAGEWKKFVDKNTKGGALEDALFEKIYGANPNDEDTPGNYVTFTPQEARNAKQIMRDVLIDVIDQIETDPGIGRAAQQRAAFLKARMRLEDLLRPPPTLPQPPPLPVKLDTADKASRAVASLFTRNKTDKRTDTQGIKKQLRDGKITGEDALKQLAKLEAASAQVAGDRRVGKIRFLIAAVDFCSQLEEMAKDLNAFLGKDQHGIWSNELGATLGAGLRAAVAEWQQAVAGDKGGKIPTRLNAAWSGFPAAVKNG